MEVYGQVWLCNEKHERINTSNFSHNHWLAGWKYSCRNTFRWRLDYFLLLCTGGTTKKKLDDASVGNQFSIIVQWNSTQCTFDRKWELLLFLILFQIAYIYTLTLKHYLHIPVIHEFIDQTTKKKHYTRTKSYCNEPLMFEKLRQSSNLRLSFSLRGISVILCPYSIWPHVEASYYTSWHKLVSTDIFFFYHEAIYYNTLVVIILFIFR